MEDKPAGFSNLAKINNYSQAKEYIEIRERTITPSQPSNRSHRKNSRRAFSRAAQNSLSSSQYSTSTNNSRFNSTESSTFSSKPQNNQMYQWMAMASLLNQDDAAEGGEDALLQELETQNRALLQMREKSSGLAGPANQRLLSRIDDLEKKLNENNKSNSGKKMSYFFNQMMMMMMMNPSKNFLL